MNRPIDHLVIAHRDLDLAMAAYRRLGFLVGGRNRHPWGTENHIIQLDGAFLELIGLGRGFASLPAQDPAAPFANGVERYLARRNGLVMLALRSADAADDARRFATLGLGPERTMSFSRTAEAPDGQRREVAFTLAFALDADDQGAGFFACQHHRPENFWNPAVQHHPNTARRLLGAVVLARTPAELLPRLVKLFGEEAIRETESGVSVALDDGQTITVATPARFRSHYGDAATTAADRPGDAAAFRIGVGSLEALRRFINVMGSPYEMRDDRLIVPPGIAKGVALSFEEIE